MTQINDTVHAFMDHPFEPVPHAEMGPLSGLTLAVKDIFDVKGYKTGCGSPEKMEEAHPARATCSSVQRLLDAGAEFVGKTTTEELAFSLNGDNIHYPQPINPYASDRLTGGSSSGSAAAVSAGLVDIATASDTGGSVRAPASYCGLIGLRATHGRLSLDNTMPLAESLDVFGWFAKDADTYQKVSDVLLGEDDISFNPKRTLIADDCLALLMNVETVRALDAAVNYMVDYKTSEDVDVADGNIDDWYQTFRTIQAYEAWQAHGEWILSRKPKLGPGVKERFAVGESITKDAFEKAAAHRLEIRKRVEDLVSDDGLLVLPTVPTIAPLKNQDFETLNAFRNRALRLLCLSGLSGLPQITLPMADLNGIPLGLSLIGPRGSDQQLVRFGLEILASFKGG